MDIILSDFIELYQAKTLSKLIVSSLKRQRNPYENVAVIGFPLVPAAEANVIIPVSLLNVADTGDVLTYACGVTPAGLVYGPYV